MKNQTLITLTNDQYSDVRKYCYERFINVQMAETNFLTTQLEQIRAGIGIAILPPYIRNALAPGIIMRDILEDPYEKTCYAMVSRSLDEKIAHHMVSLIREAYICLSEMPADSH